MMSSPAQSAPSKSPDETPRFRVRRRNAKEKREIDRKKRVVGGNPRGIINFDVGSFLLYGMVEPATELARNNRSLRCRQDWHQHNND